LRTEQPVERERQPDEGEYRRKIEEQVGVGIHRRTLSTILSIARAIANAARRDRILRQRGAPIEWRAAHTISRRLFAAYTNRHVNYSDKL
jgi:hypothetical protein